MSNSVDRPAHYNSHPSGVEAIVICECMSFNVGNAIKYAMRHEHKGNPVEDLKKARWYIEREISRLEVENGRDKTALTPRGKVL